MTTLTERTIVQFIKVQPGTGRIDVAREVQVLRGATVIASAVTAQALEPGQDLSALDLEPEVLAVVAAIWTPAQLEQAAAELLARQQEHKDRMDRALADAQRSSAAVEAAMTELQAEQNTLAERTEQVAAERASLFQQREAIRKQRPQLDALMNEMAAAVEPRRK